MTTAGSGSVALFVYGSLKRGFPNHHWMRGARFVKEARTAPHYGLGELAGYPVLCRDGVQSIHGELFTVDDPHCATLDRFEGRSYARAEIVLSDGSRAEAYVVEPDVRALARALHTDEWAGR